MAFVTVNDISMYYEQHGQGDDLLLISGFTADHTAWEFLVPLLSKHFRVTVFDNRGAGQTDAPDMEYSTRLLADDAAALLKALDIKQAYVAGHSMGGHIVQQLLINHADVIKKAVIICSKVFPSPVSTLHFFVNTELQKLGVDEALILKNEATFVFGPSFLNDPDNLDWYIKRRLNNPRPQTDVGYERQKIAVTTHNVKDQLSQVSADALVIGCEKDILLPLENSEFIAAAIKGAKLEVIPDSGHMVIFEQPQALATHIIDFCR